MTASISTRSIAALARDNASISLASARASFPRDFRLIEPDEPLPPAIDETRDLGFMLYDIDHAGDRSSLFFRARLDKGVMRVPAPGSPEIRR